MLVHSSFMLLFGASVLFADDLLPFFLFPNIIHIYFPHKIHIYYDFEEPAYTDIFNSFIFNLFFLFYYLPFLFLVNSSRYIDLDCIIYLTDICLDLCHTSHCVGVLFP